jgi:hypothetical protein
MELSKSKKKKFIVLSKKESRIENSISRKNNRQLLDEFIDEYSQSKFKTNDSLIEESKKILKDLNKDTIRDKAELELRYDALLTIMDSKLKESYKSNFKTFVGYPDYEDPLFNTKITSKKEFNINKIPPRTILSKEEKEDMSKQLCDPMHNSKKKEDITFNLTHNQKFLKTFLSPQTPYNSMLLFHGTGVGKTCSSISIAEQYSDELKKLNKKIIILLNPSIEANFIKNIFNIQKVIKGTPYYQCTGSKYLDEIKIDLDIFDSISDEMVQKIQYKINKIIKGRYEFYGYQKFANLIENLQRKIKAKHNETNYNHYLNKVLKERFSDTVMIIDEVHNIKQSNELKVLPPLLEKVVKNAINMKLLLLSATPMFDTSNEIFFLINLMLRNDNRALINGNKYIDPNGTLIPSMTNDFVRKIRGYISYMRGEDPYRFPDRLYPNTKMLIDTKNMPNKDNNGDLIEDDNRIKDLKIVPCVMKDLQLLLYEQMESSKEKYGAFKQPAIMCSNIVYPKKGAEGKLASNTYKLGNFISDKGFNNIIDTIKNGKDIKYIIHDEYKDFFNLDVLSNYATKIVQLIKNIEQSNGIVFVYSQFLNSGIIPIALALEYMGYSKYGNPLTNSKAKQLGNYIIISGTADLSSNAYSEYIKIQDSNKNGEKIKIILGTQTAAEGLDFSYIREVHILEPWFHLNKLEQVIGRAIRNCSHIELDSKERNVTIYLYAAVKSLKPINDNETVDLETYRKAELKSKQMSEIEYLLKISSVDCYLNKNGNYFGPEYDVDFSKQCNYKECDYKCLSSITETTLNEDTFNEDIIADNINDAMKEIIKLYKKNYYYTIDDFIEIFKYELKLPIDQLLLFFALNKLLTYTGKIVDKNDSKGKIIYNNGYYIFVKKHGSKFVSINNIKKHNTKRINSLNISRNNTLLELKKFSRSFDVKPPSLDFIFTQAKPIIKKYLKKNNLLNESLYKSCEVTSIKDDLRNISAVIIRESRYYLDFMPLSEKEILIKYLIIKSFPPNKLTDDENTIMKSIYNILYNKEDLWYDDIRYKGIDGEIWGYKVVDNKKIRYMEYKGGDIFNNASINDVKQIQKSFKKKLKIEPSPANIIGYYELKLPQNTLLFKIRDKTNQGIKGTQIKTGSICDNDGMKKSTIIDYIEKLLKIPIYADSGVVPNKTLLCKHLELILRFLNITDTKHRYFYGPEETIEYNLNKKII